MTVADPAPCPSFCSSTKWRPSAQHGRDRRPSLVFYGDASLESQVFQGHRTQGGLPGRIKKHIERANAQGRLVCIDISEHLTSQICSACGNRTLRHATRSNVESSIYSVLMCTTCSTHWNKDTNSARNILAKGLHHITHGRYQHPFIPSQECPPNETRPRR